MRLTVFCVVTALVLGLSACTDTNDSTTQAASTTPASHTGPSMEVALHSVPWRLTDASPTVRTIRVTALIGGCQVIKRTIVRHHRSHPRYAWPVEVTTITVWVGQRSSPCIDGVSVPRTRVIKARHPMLGCSSKLVDGSTGQPPMIKPGLRRQLVWNCPSA